MLVYFITLLYTYLYSAMPSTQTGSHNTYYHSKDLGWRFFFLNVFVSKSLMLASTAFIYSEIQQKQ